MKKYSIITLLFLAGCSGVHFSKTGTLEPLAREPGCGYAVYTTMPERKFSELGVISFTGPPARKPKTVDKVRELSGETICTAGGNALLLWDVNGYGTFLKGTVIQVQD
ncbi:MAG: hypothetical protein K0U59_00600 [Gammaproteobacteria bacterium]|nr:hypothetical protein [Gammaproteobacteria bacterium]